YLVKNKTIFGEKTVGLQPDGSILVPSNQLLQPAGFQVYLPGRPVDLALSNDEKTLLVKNMHSLDLVNITDRTILQSLRFPHGGASPIGLCVAEDGQTIYVSDADNHINIASLSDNSILQWKEA